MLNSFHVRAVKTLPIWEIFLAAWLLPPSFCLLGSYNLMLFHFCKVSLDAIIKNEEEHLSLYELRYLAGILLLQILYFFSFRFCYKVTANSCCSSRISKAIACLYKATLIFHGSLPSKTLPSFWDLRRSGYLDYPGQSDLWYKPTLTASSLATPSF